MKHHQSSRRRVILSAVREADGNWKVVIHPVLASLLLAALAVAAGVPFSKLVPLLQK